MAEGILQHGKEFINYLLNLLRIFILVIKFLGQIYKLLYC